MNTESPESWTGTPDSVLRHRRPAASVSCYCTGDGARLRPSQTRNTRDLSENAFVWRRSKLEYHSQKDLFFIQFLIAIIIMTSAVCGNDVDVAQTVSFRGTAAVDDYTTSTTTTARRRAAVDCSNYQVTRIHPSRGPAAGGTVLTVFGRCLNSSADVRVFVGNESTCATLTRDYTQLTCTMSAVDVRPVPVSGYVKLVFDHGRSIVYKNKPFAYVAVHANQTFGGIVSGGTTFWVRGRFPWNDTVRAIIGDDDGGRSYNEKCTIRNDTHMSCRSPSTYDVDRLRKTLPLKFRDDFAFAPPPGWDQYRLYPDPSVAELTVDGCCDVTVSGRNLLDVGYSRTDDLAVWLLDANASVAACVVSEVHVQRIACRSVRPLQQPITLILRIGEHFATNVSQLQRIPSRISNSARTLNYLPGFAVTAVYVLFVPVLCVALFSLKSLRITTGTAKRYDMLTLERCHQRTEMRPLNNGDGDGSPWQDVDDETELLQRSAPFAAPSTTTTTRDDQKRYLH